jgi:FAD/FMN-containing dehydrogenase
LIDVYDRLAAHGLALPGGTCADLGIAGLTLGGGIGVISRAYGLTCDNLRAVDLVTADGEILTCDAERDPDLFWACRGGGGGNFGIATSFVFQTRPARDITRLSFEWPWSRAARVMQAWQEWAPLAPDEVWSQCYFGTGTAGEPPVVKARAVVLGSRGDLEGVTEPLLARVGAEPVQTTEAQSYLATMLTFAGCDGWSVAQCRLSGRSPEGRLQRAAYAAKSDFFDKPLPADALDAIVHHIEQGKAVDGLHHGELTFGVLGGAVGRIHPAETAFVHRRAIFDAQYLSFWQSGASAETEERSVAWLRSLHRAMRPHATGGAYVNYIDPELPDWQNAYYGANYARLLRVKARYDPHQVFRFPQAIGTA